MGDDWDDEPVKKMKNVKVDDDDDDWDDDAGEAAPSSSGGYGGGGGGYQARGGGGGGGGFGGGGGGRGCFNCGEEGHRKDECPAPLKQRGPMVCFNCQQDGHRSSDCTNERVERPRRDGGGGGGSMKCYNCQEDGHRSSDCTNAKVERSFGGGGGGSMKCYNCQEDGHRSSDCTNAKVERTFGGGGGGGGGGNKCYNCQEEGHRSNECTNERVERTPRRDRDDDGGFGASGGGGSGRGCFNCGEEGHRKDECTNERKPRPRMDENGVEIPEKPKENYIPQESTVDEFVAQRKSEWGGSGINFSKYKNIETSVSGDNPPPKAASYADMKLRDLIIGNVRDLAGYKEPTPIQQCAIPILTAGRDLMACAQTGSGKTAAFLLPIIQHLLINQNELPTVNQTEFPVEPFVLILAPTRELVIQIHKEGSIYSHGSIVKIKMAYGGVSVQHMKRQLLTGCHILVATPGRLKMYINENTISLNHITHFILDEADRMLDMGFMDDVKEIRDKMPNKPISAMFSATFPQDVQALAKTYLSPNYLFVAIGTVGGACSDVEQTFLQVEKSEKRDTAFKILRDMKPEDKILIFVGTKKGADFLAAGLIREKITATSIHGDRLQSQRETALREFTSGRHKILVATAVAARGLDIPKVNIVLNYDLPTEIDEYVHRIGRTGRVGHTGKAISFFDGTKEEDMTLAPKLIGILNGAGQPVPDFLASYGIDSGMGGFASHDTRGGVPAVVENGGGEEEWSD